jgi:hypothetical protein
MPETDTAALKAAVAETLAALPGCYICRVPFVDFDEIVEARQFQTARPADVAPDAQGPWFVHRTAHTGCWRNKIDSLTAEARARETAAFRRHLEAQRG